MSIFHFFRENSHNANNFCCDKVDYYWYVAIETFCKIHNKEMSNFDSENLNEDEENIVWEYAGNHIAFFLIWAFQNQIGDEEMFEEEELQLLRRDKRNGVRYGIL